MFGDEEYLDMFIEVYASTMRYLQLPINIRNHSFLVDVHMDSGEWVRHRWGRDGVLREVGWARHSTTSCKTALLCWWALHCERAPHCHYPHPK